MSHETTGGYANGNGGYRNQTRYDRDDDEPPSIAVASALASHFGEDVTEPSVPLYEYVDPEALDALFDDRFDGRTRAGGQVRFDVAGATVVVRPDSVTVRDAD